MNTKLSFLGLFLTVIVITIWLTFFEYSPGLEGYTKQLKTYGIVHQRDVKDGRDAIGQERSSRTGHREVTEVESQSAEGSELASPSVDGTEDASQSADKTKDAGHSLDVAGGQRANGERLKNVLFVIVDDLRPQLGVYHDAQNPDYFSKVRMYTPNIDKFASKSLVFERAYAQYSLCGPSRASLLTSRRPDVTRVYGNHDYWRVVGGNFTTLPQHFKDNGYYTVGIAKVFHPGPSSNGDDPPSWSVPYYHSVHRDRHYVPSNSSGWLAAPKSETENVPLVDMFTAETATVILDDVALDASKRPFLLAVGFHKPHLSMVCPEQYFDKYPLEEEGRFLANASWHRPLVRSSVRIDGAETGAEERTLPPDVLKYLRRAYFACVSYIDDMFGKILRKLNETGLAEETVVSFTADHGFHLGENRHWGKVTTWEFANRVPLIIRIPGLTDAGLVTSSIVESIDIFPTLVEAAGLAPLPSCSKDARTAKLCTQGVSLMPLVERPDQDIVDAAFSQIVAQDGMRYTIRTNRYRLVESAFVYNMSLPDGGFELTVEWQQNRDRIELYDHDKDILEQNNLVNNEQYADVVEELRQRLHEFVEGLIK